MRCEGKIQMIEAEMAPNDAEIKAADATHNLMIRWNVRRMIIKGVKMQKQLHTNVTEKI